MSPGRAPRFARSWRAGLLLGALAAGQVAGCRGALGIDGLDLAEEGVDEGGGASSPGGDGAGAGPGESKSCAAACAKKAGKKGLEAYYGGAQGCACDADDATSCAAACAGDCDVEPDELADAPAACVACIAEKTRSPACEDALADCDKDCAAFRACIEACPG
ncbi:MAG TPA: hypothetical protein VFS43_10850 [Polyangiaceae bacterium]|nr:hypothetical protein [Polyangiaceae bacterium]